MSTELSAQRHEQNNAMSIATSRQAQEVQAAMIVAKQFPRDEIQAIERLKRACQRPGLAECSMYSYPKGGQKVEGPSIRLAEAMAQAWGNIDYGIIELSQKHGESSVMAYAWDLETNTRRQMVFQVSHYRHTRQGSTLLTDPREIYEMMANQGARRVRACILGVIPGDVQDLAVAECEKTLSGDGGKPIADRIRDMVIAFKELGVSKEMLEARLQHPVTACTSANIAQLQKIYLSIRDGISKREDWFELNPGTSAEKPETGKSRTEQATSRMSKQKADQQQKPADDPQRPQPLTDQAINEATTVEHLENLADQLKAEREGMQQEEYDYLLNMIGAKRKALAKR